jgi:hypothetical protein
MRNIVDLPPRLGFINAWLVIKSLLWGCVVDIWVVEDVLGAIPNDIHERARLRLIRHSNNPLKSRIHGE